LGTRCADQALRTGFAGTANCASDAVLGAPFCARRSDCALWAGITGTANCANNSGCRAALGTRCTGYALPSG
jgi:hypothetical protein